MRDRNKLYICTFLLWQIIIFPSSAKQYTSAATGNWNAPATWGSATAPGATDTVTITSGKTVTISAAATINKVTINSGGTVTLNRSLTVNKIIINNGSLTGARALILSGSGIVISGNGSYASHTSTIQFNNSVQTIDVGVVIQKATGNIRLNNTNFPGMRVTNNGQVILTGGNTLTTQSNVLASTFTMGANSVLTVSAIPLNNNSATLNASANGCTVNYNGAGNYNIKIPSGNQYYDLGITGSGTITNTAALIMHSLNVVSGATYAVGGFAQTLSGNWTNNGTISGNTNTVTFNGASAQTITDASGTAAFAALTMSGTNTLSFASNVSTTGIFTISSGTVDVSASNHSLTVKGNFTNNGGTFTARNGTVTMNGAAAQTIGGTSSTTFYNLTLSGTTVTLGNNETIKNTLLVSSGTLDASASNYSLNVGQNFTNNSTFNARSATVTFTGNTTTPLNINGSISTSFYNLTINTANATDIVLQGIATTVSNNFTISKGTFNSQNFQLTGNATGLMSMAANTSLLLGLITSGTNISFPTGYTAAHIALNASSTVTYQANTSAQIIAVVPTYGNVVVTNGATAVIKTPGGTPLKIGGDLTISKGTASLTLSETNNNINLTGNYTSNGILSFTTGSFNIGGDFTNNGTFTAGIGSVTFNGAAPQTLGGTSTTTFNLLTINNSGNSTITLGQNAIVSSTLTITKGTLDVSASNYSITEAGNFTNNSAFNSRSGTVTLNGAAAQSIGGTSATSFYNLTLSGTTITLNHDESVQSVLTINSGALNGPDTLTMLSNSTRTARIAPVVAGASIGATFTMQRYITGITANYQSLGSPAKAAILKDWDTDPGFYMSGVSGVNGNATRGGRTYYSVYKYNETTNKYDSVNTVNQPLTPGLGLYLWMGNSLTSFSPFTFATHGIPNFGTVNYNVTKNGSGLNLIGNPYDSPLQWTSFQTTNNTRLNNIFYVFDETTGNWEHSNGAMGTAGRIQTNPNIIPAHQGFIISAISAGVIHFNEAHKGVNDAPIIRMEEPANLMRIALTTNANTFSGHIIIEFNDSSSDLYKPCEDALHIKSLLAEAPVLYSLSSDGEQLVHDVIPGSMDQDVTIYAGGGDEGMYTLTFTNVSSIGNYNCILLEDVKSGKWKQVNEGTTYNFVINQNGQKSKFVLHFKNLLPGQDCLIPDENTSVTQNDTEGIDVMPSQTGAQIVFNLPTSEEATVSAFNTLGEKVINDIKTNVMKNTIQVPLAVEQGIYIIRVQTDKEIVNKRIYCN